MVTEVYISYKNANVMQDKSISKFVMRDYAKLYMVKQSVKSETN